MQVDAIRESHLNTTEGHWLGEPVITEDPFTDDVGELFRFAQREFGRCESSVYLDPAGEGVLRRVGWVFTRREQYSDSEDTFTHEVWVELLIKVGEHSYSPFDLNRRGQPA